ncbi:MAG: phosphatidate cytidylyltransferase [Clostridium sp.]|nr:phosphatidate cytidylyltransferase [Clostridium sp.]
MKNVVVRSISGLVYIAVIVLAILFGWRWFACLTSAFTLLAILEYSKVAEQKLEPLALLTDAVAALALTLIPVGLMGTGLDWLGYCGCAALPICFLARLTIALFDDRENPFDQTARSALGVAYVGLPMLCLNALYLTNLAITPELTLIMFVLIWLNDTGAFCFGTLLGKHKLCERLSPKKSWEGFWGGMGCCVLFGAVSCFTFNDANLPLGFWLIFGAATSLFATWGDLFESLMKRSMRVKDSGHLIPGHGGILDRIDSLLFCAPATLMIVIVALQNL